MQEFRSWDANQAKTILKIIKKQLKPPLVALLSGTPMNDGLGDLAFPFALINSLWQQAPPTRNRNRRNLQVRDDIADVRRKLKRLQRTLHGTLPADDRREIATTLSGYFYKSLNATFKNRPILKLTESTREIRDCPIADAYVDALTQLTIKAGTEVMKKLHDALSGKTKVKAKKRPRC